MKVNDYVKYENEIVKVIDFSPFDENEVILSNGIMVNKNDFTLLTPEETLEMFKGRFEELGYKLRPSDYEQKYSCDVINEDTSIIVCENYIDPTIKFPEILPNSLIDLIREFQNWYWRDK